MGWFFFFFFSSSPSLLLSSPARRGLLALLGLDNAPFYCPARAFLQAGSLRSVLGVWGGFGAADGAACLSFPIPGESSKHSGPGACFQPPEGVPGLGGVTAPAPFLLRARGDARRSPAPTSRPQSFGDHQVTPGGIGMGTSASGGWPVLSTLEGSNQLEQQEQGWTQWVLGIFGGKVSRFGPVRWVCGSLQPPRPAA